MSHVNIVKKIKIDGDWKLLSIPRNAKGSYDWNALPEGLYLIEWRAGGKRRRESAGVTAAQALEAQRRKRHELEGRKLGVPGFELAGETPKTPRLHVAVHKYLAQIEALKKPNTHRKYEAVLDRFVEFFRDKESIDQIGCDDLTRYIIALKKEHSLGANTILHNAIIVAQFFKRQGRGGITRGPQLAPTVYALERLRCGACGQVFTAQEPEGVGPEKYDETAAAMIAQLKYGSGTPFHRLEKLEGQLGIPLPAATQWEIVEEAAELIQPVRDELIRQAAQGEVVHNDDTNMRVLKLEREPGDQRTGVFTSGIVSTGQGQKIALYFTGRQHAGENIGDVLKQRAKELSPLIQMCDALSRNVPKQASGVEILVAHCLAHGRRQFVEVAANFPEECRYVLEMLGEVYRHDAEAREGGLTATARLQFHQQHSQPVMEKLHIWLEAQLAERKTEPNSGLGKAITYLLRHWKALTMFLREAGAPLDNNICERALKRAVLHRKNALFYRTLHGAGVGDLFMTLIHTCQLCGANSFDYLTELLRHASELAAKPAEWMPWNYRQTLERAGGG